MNLRVLFVCGMLLPVVHVMMTFLGGALRPGYNHISDTVSELLSPGAPNKPLLVVFQIAHALLGSLFGMGVLQFFRESQHNALIGRIGAGIIITVGVATIATAIFLKIAAGAPPTVAGRLHSILVFGVLVPFTILSTLLIGIWMRQAGVFLWFRTYSFITIAASVLLAGLAGTTLDTPVMGLTERLGVLGFSSRAISLDLGGLECYGI